MQATRTKTMYRERIERDQSIDLCLSVCVVEHIYIYIYIYIYICETTTTNKREYIGVCCWLAWWGWVGYRPPPGRPLLPNPSKQRTLNGIALHAIIQCVCATNNGGYLVDPASSHMLVSKIKPCMSKYKLLYCETANGSLNQLSSI